MQTLAVSKEVAGQILAQAERRFSVAFGNHPKIKPVQPGKLTQFPFIGPSVLTIKAPEVWCDGYLAGWLIGYRHMDATGVLPIKPKNGFAEIVHKNGKLGAICDNEVQNWAELPANLHP